MLGRLCLSVLLLASVAACDPKPAEPDGTPSDAPALDGAPKGPDASSELDGGAPAHLDAAGSSVLGIVPPMGVQVINDCEKVIAADYTSPPKMACLLFRTEDTEAGKLDAGIFAAISEAGWSQVRALGNEFYFERPRAGTDCSEVAVVSVLTDRLEAVVDHLDFEGRPIPGTVWQAYAIPAAIRETCGADRMKP